MEQIGEIEKQLWASADNLRANSNFASNEYFLPVMGLIFLRHAYSRFLKIKAEIKSKLPVRGGKTRALIKEDFSQKGAIFLRPEAQFDHLVSLPDSADRAQAIINAMEGIEKDYENLRGSLPKAEYQELDNDVLGQILRTFNASALQQADGDIFGRIYEYFLTQFADLKAHDGGEFFTPASLVQMIVNVIEPQHGRLLDPACGSGGMFVQSAYFIERMHENPTEQVTFYGMEKNSTTIRLANMNLAVHGLEGNIRKAITYYEDPHEMVGNCDFVMANPPFNVDEVDAEKVKNDPRLRYGLPGVNKKDKVPNGNYLWISYFDNYLNDQGRAGFVMSSQASSAGGEEAKVRKKLIEAGHVDIMMAIRSGFFYTRTVPCELWFLDRAKPDDYHNKVLMIDARNVYRRVTRKIYDFTPEQQKNLSAIVWLYRGQFGRFVALIAKHFDRMISEAVKGVRSLKDFAVELAKTIAQHTDCRLPNDLAVNIKELKMAQVKFREGADVFEARVQESASAWGSTTPDNESLKVFAEKAEPLANECRDLIRQAGQLYKMLSRAVDTTTKNWRGNPLKELDEARGRAVEQLELPSYFWRQAQWLQERFPDAKLRDIEGLVRLVDKTELAANDWSLTPGRYVGVAPEEDEDFDFVETLREIHVELKELNKQAVILASNIHKNFENLDK